MKTIIQRAKSYANCTACKGEREAFAAGASTVIEELKAVLSVSEDKYLRENIMKMIKFGGQTMTRQEQRTKAAKAYVKDITTDIPASLKVAFTKGAEWADAHPDEGLVSIDRVCEYLANHIDKELVIYNDNTWLKRDEFIKKLKKEINK